MMNDYHRKGLYELSSHQNYQVTAWLGWAGLVDADFLAQYLQIIFHVRWRVSLQAFTTDK